MSEPLDLDAIERVWNDPEPHRDGYWSDLARRWVVPDLIAEVRRLRLLLVAQGVISKEDVRVPSEE